VIIYGRNAVRESLRGRRAPAVGRLWATPAAAREAWLRERDPVLVERRELERLCGSPGHQGVCADAGPYPYVSPSRLIGGSEGLVVALDRIQDPQNLGAICRSAECAGALGVVLAERRAAEVTPAVCKASAGAVEHLAVARVTNLADFLTRAKQAGAWCYGAAAQRGRPFREPDYGPRVVLVLGAEGRGLGPRVARCCDELVSIPLRGKVGSLNVGAAAAVLMYAILQNGPRRLDRDP
jgi:23S rRNA (guanosine2251-2'-O)-methyltransferase